MLFGFAAIELMTPIYFMLLESTSKPYLAPTGAFPTTATSLEHVLTTTAAQVVFMYHHCYNFRIIILLPNLKLINIVLASRYLNPMNLFIEIPTFNIAIRNIKKIVSKLKSKFQLKIKNIDVNKNMKKYIWDK